MAGSPSCPQLHGQMTWIGTGLKCGTASGPRGAGHTGEPRPLLKVTGNMARYVQLPSHEPRASPPSPAEKGVSQN